MHYSDVQDKSIALLIWNTEKENDAHVYLGKITMEGSQLIFVNNSQNWRLRLSEEDLERIMAVTEDTKEIFLNAAYFISMTMASLPGDSNENFESTRLKWH